MAAASDAEIILYEKSHKKDQNPAILTTMDEKSSKTAARFGVLTAKSSGK
jgi:hypothetical protein